MLAQRSVSAAQCRLGAYRELVERSALGLKEIEEIDFGENHLMVAHESRLLWAGLRAVGNIERLAAMTPVTDPPSSAGS